MKSIRGCGRVVPLKVSEAAQSFCYRKGKPHGFKAPHTAFTIVPRTTKVNENGSESEHLEMTEGFSQETKSFPGFF